MTHMNTQFHIAPIAAALVLAACDRSSPRVATAESLLSRDLTLAGATPTTSAAPRLGDTASATNKPVALLKATSAPFMPPASSPSPPAAAARTTASAPPQAGSTPTAPPTVPTGPLPIGTPVPYGVNYNAAAEKAVAASTGGSGGNGAKELPFGTVITGRTNGQICARANRPGDKLVITTTTDSFGPDGARLPAGSQIVVEMTAPEAGSEFAFRAKSVQVDTALLPIYGTVRVDSPNQTTRTVQPEGAEKKSTLGTAMKGAILGGLLGGRKGAIIGAAGAVAAGAVIDRRNAVSEHCLPSGVSLSVILSAPLVLGQGAK